MRNKKIIYWSVTGLFSAYMILTAIPNVTLEPQSVTMITGLGYPEYFIRMIGIAKIIGAIAILLPNLRRLKEWAYAGLFFDLAAATISIVMMGGLNAQIIFMIIPIIFLFVSYYYWHQIIGTK